MIVVRCNKCGAHADIDETPASVRVKCTACDAAGPAVTFAARTDDAMVAAEDDAVKRWNAGEQGDA